MDFDHILSNYGGLFDAFGNIKTSSHNNRSDVEFIYDKQPLLFEDLSAGSGTATHQANGRDVLLAVGGATTNDVAHMRSKTWIPYTPGNAQLVELTGVMDKAGIGGGSIKTFLRSTVSGSTVTNTYDFEQWTYASSKNTENLDFTKSQIFAIDFQSLKVGTIRFGFVRHGVFKLVHIIDNDNIRGAGYWQYPSLPPYVKIYNTATNTIIEFGYGDDSNGVGYQYVFPSVQSGATSTLICETVKSSNGVSIEEIPGFNFAYSNGTATKTVSTTLIPILSIRVAATINSIANRGLYVPLSYVISTDNAVHYKLIYRPTLTNASFQAVDGTYSGMEYDTTASAITGGVVIDHDYLNTGVNQRTSVTNLIGRVLMSLGSSADILTVAAIRNTSNNAAVQAAIKWKEIR